MPRLPEATPTLGPSNALEQAVLNLDLNWNFGDGSRPVLLYGRELQHFSAVYGIVPDPSAPEYKIGVPLEELADVHHALHETVLIDESGFEAKITKPPEPTEVTGSRPNTDAWLDWISKGVWPMPLHVEKARQGFILGSTVRSVVESVPVSFVWDHDYRNRHVANLVLSPKETGERIRTVAAISSERRLNGTEDPFILPSKTAETDTTLGYKIGNNGEVYLDYADPPWSRVDGLYNGAHLIDQVTDQSAYLELLAIFLDAPDHQALVLGITDIEEKHREEGTLMRYWGSSLENKDITDRIELWYQFSEIALANIALQNFITRHQEERNLTAQEQQAIFDESLIALSRVATKIKLPE